MMHGRKNIKLLKIAGRNYNSFTLFIYLNLRYYENEIFKFKSLATVMLFPQFLVEKR